jgi:hypothetical protein
MRDDDVAHVTCGYHGAMGIGDQVNRNHNVLADLVSVLSSVSHTVRRKDQLSRSGNGWTLLGTRYRSNMELPNVIPGDGRNQMRMR